MKNFILLIVVCFLTINTNAQKSSNFAITQKGETIKFYGNYLSIGDRFTYYTDEKKKEIKIKNNELKLLVNGNLIYLNLPTTKGIGKIQKILAYTDKYVLTSHTHLSMTYI